MHEIEIKKIEKISKLIFISVKKTAVFELKVLKVWLLYPLRYKAKETNDSIWIISLDFDLPMFYFTAIQSKCHNCWGLLKSGRIGATQGLFTSGRIILFGFRTYLNEYLRTLCILSYAQMSFPRRPFASNKSIHSFLDCL